MKTRSDMTAITARLLSIAIAVAASAVPPAHAADLVQPRQLIVDASLPEAQREANLTLLQQLGLVAK
jgi:hypothetical protein